MSKITEGFTTVYLGNSQAVTVADVDDGKGGVRRTRTPRRDLGKTRTEVKIPDEGNTRQEKIQAITDPEGVWAYHSEAEKPGWVASDDQELAEALGAIYGTEVREPKPEGERGEFDSTGSVPAPSPNGNRAQRRAAKKGGKR